MTIYSLDVVGAPKSFDSEGQWGLIAEAPQDLGKQTLLLEGVHKVLDAVGLRAKAVTS